MYTPAWVQRAQFFEGWSFFDRVPGNFEESRTIHGALKKLPKGYAYMSVPPEAIVKPIISECTVHLAKSFNAAKIFVSLFQAIYSFYTLVHDSHYQIQHFGFSAFPLTVTPYAVMSIVNLLGGLLFPVYPAIFLVQSEVSVEVEQCHGRMFDGMVGSLSPLEDNPTMFVMQGQDNEDIHSAVVLGPEATDHDLVDDLAVSIPTFPPFQHLEPLFSGPILSLVLRPVLLSLKLFRLIYRPYMLIYYLILTFWARQPLLILRTRNAIFFFLSDVFAIGVPIVIIGALSGFEVGGSTIAQRVWVMMWFACGAVLGPLFLFNSVSEEGQQLSYSVGLLYSAPAIGGFAVVVQMISTFGNCQML